MDAFSFLHKILFATIPVSVDSGVRIFRRGFDDVTFLGVVLGDLWLEEMAKLLSPLMIGVEHP